MKRQISPEKKLADWESAFYSTNNSRKDEALKALIDGLRTEIKVASVGAV